MILNHYTVPANTMLIIGTGLRAGAKEQYAHMTTNGEPVVWLTRELSNHVTPEIFEWFKARSISSPDIGKLGFGGSARIVVDIPRHDKRLVRYLDYCEQYGIELLPGCRARFDHWWIYRGDVVPRRVTMEPMTTAQLLECMDRHIKTCPDPTIVAMLKAMRSGIEAESELLWSWVRESEGKTLVRLGSSKRREAA